MLRGRGGGSAGGRGGGGATAGYGMHTDGGSGGPSRADSFGIGSPVRPLGGGRGPRANSPGLGIPLVPISFSITSSRFHIPMLSP